MAQPFTNRALNYLASNPLNGTMEKNIATNKTNSDVASIAKHFGLYFQPVLASEKAQQDAALRIRHNVYCEELAFEERQADGKETDEFDAYSIMCLIKHRTTSLNAGTVRLVRPLQKGQQLPITKYCVRALERAEKHPDDYPVEHVCEISRLAVPKAFRRRQVDNFDGAATGVINETTFSDEELRCFPFIAVGLYLSAAAMCHDLDIRHVFVMMEPRLARSMRLVGINFEQLGPAIEYHGKRAPYYIKPKDLLDSLSPGFIQLLQAIEANLEPQLKAALAKGLVS